jgi:hypothetical protein
MANVGTYTPPTVQEAYNIIKGLEGQVGNIASSQYNIISPYVNEALSSFRNFPNTLNQIFGDTQNSITNRFSDLFSNIQTQMNNQWNKSALNLSAMGMYNTPATQYTQSDIVNQLFGRVAEEKTNTLNKLDAGKLQSLVDYYSRVPQVLASFGETLANINPDINKYTLQTDLAKILNGLNTIAYPKTSPLAQASQMLGSAFLQSNGLSSLGGLINSVSNLFSGGSAGFLPDISGDVGSAVSGVFDGVGGFLGGATDVASDVGDAFGIGDALGDVGDAFGIGDVLGDVGDIFGGGDILGDVLDIGLSLF